MSIEFITVRDRKGFAELEPEWRRLFSSLDDAHFYQNFDWCWHSWECLALKLGRRLRILVGRVEQRVVLIWPMMIGGPYLRFLNSEYGEFLDALVEPGPSRDEWLQAAMSAVGRLGAYSLLLRRVRADSDVGQFIQRRGTRAFVAPPERSRILRLDRFATWDAYLASLPNHLMADQRRQWRRLSECGEVEFAVQQDWSVMRDTIRWIFDHKIAWLQGRGMTINIFGSAPHRAFIEAVACDLHKSGMTFVTSLTVEGKIASALLGFRNRSYFVFFMFSYDPAWSRYSPSRLLMERSMRWCHHNGIASFDFLVGDEEYKRTWATDEVALHNYLVPLTLPGRAIAAWHRSRYTALTDTTWFRLIARLTPAPVRRRIRGRVQSNAELIARMKPMHDRHGSSALAAPPP